MAFLWTFATLGLSAGNAAAQELDEVGSRLTTTVLASAGRAGIGHLDHLSCGPDDAIRDCLSADGGGLALGVGWLQRRNHFRWSLRAESTIIVGSSGVALQLGPALEIGMSFRWFDLSLGSGVAILWLSDRRELSVLTPVVPARFALALRITRHLALVPQATGYFGDRVVGAFVGAGVEWAR
jgi:hypothetical protein